MDKLYLDERTINTDNLRDKNSGIFREGDFKILGDSKLKELKCIHDWIFNDLKGIDNPSAFYMNPLADLTCRNIEVDNLINTIIDVQPKEGGGSGSQSKESIVENMIISYKARYESQGFDIEKCFKELNNKGGMFNEKDSANKGDGLTFPLNVFYKFEIERYQNIVVIMKRTLDDIRSAIAGEIIMTEDLNEAINALSVGRIPFTWLYNAAGEEISWLRSSIVSWYKQYEDRFIELD